MPCKAVNGFVGLLFVPINFSQYLLVNCC